MRSDHDNRRLSSRPQPWAGFRLAALLALVLTQLVSSRAAPSQPAETVIDIPILAAGYGTRFYEETARQFEALRPGVKIHLYGDPRMAEQVRVRVIGGSHPDITTVDLPWPKLIAEGKLVDLTPYLDGPDWEGDARWRDTFLPGALEGWQVGGHTYALPFAYSCWTIFYNRRIFERLGLREPRTWDDFFAACDRIRKAGIAPLALPGVYLRYGDTFLLAAYYNQVGPRGWAAYNALAPGARTSPAFVRAAGVVRRLAAEDLMPGWQGMTHTGAQLAFLEGRAAMTISGSWFVNEMKGKIPPGFELGAMNFPVWPDGKADPTAIQTSSDYYFVFRQADPRRTRIAIDFLRYLTSRERAAAFVSELDSPVAVKGIPLDRFSPLMRESARVIYGARSTYSSPPRMLQPEGLQQVMTDARQQLFTGQTTAAAFGARLEAAARVSRERLADPDFVQIRHPMAGRILIVLVLALASGFAAVKLLRRRRRPAGPAEGGAAVDARPRLGLGRAAGFVGPAFALYALFILGPGVVSFAWAFTRSNGLGGHAWVGLTNFKWLVFESDAFWFALRNNAFLVVVPALVVIPLSLGLAYMIHRGVWGGGALRAILLFPNLLGGVAATLLWMNAYEPHGGLVNAGLSALGRLLGWHWLAGFDGFPWLAPEYLYWSMIPIYVWMACGFNLVLYLAAMEGIDGELYEAAAIDGAPQWRQFFSITLPTIREVVAISAVFLVIGGLNAFEMVWLLTSQDPATSLHTLGTLLVTTLFKEFDVGRATAIAATMLALVLAASAAVLGGARRADD